MKKDPLYITTTLPYVNSEPHLGFAGELVQADVVARFWRGQGRDVFFNTGTDEHGVKIFQKAKETNVEVQKYVDGYAEKFKALIPALGVSPDVHFVRTTDTEHIRAAEEFWKRVDVNGYIYKKKYQTKYCIGCELEKTDSELENGKCPIHPTYTIELVDEENYFFKFSAFGEKLLALYKDHPDFVVPDFRFNEIKAFVERGLEDFSISRLASKMPWGVPVPGDATQVMYVWFDALVSYLSTLGWPEKSDFLKYWPPIQFAGKDNLRQQSAMFQAMLMAACIPASSQIVIRGFIISGGQKMSKSVGNVISPQDVLNTFVPFSPYATDVLRFFLMHDVLPFEDSDITMERLKDSYNTNLANGLGNLVSRVMKMATSYEISLEHPEKNKPYLNDDLVRDALLRYNTKHACDNIWDAIRTMDSFIQARAPFKKIKMDPEEAKKDILQLLQSLYDIARMLETIMPETAKEITRLIAENKSPEKPLFARLEK